jgi:1,4-alpha-glucan branching enzyme
MSPRGKAKSARKAAPNKEAAVKAPSRKRVTFSVSAEPGSRVAVSGDFNSWDTTGHPMEDKKGDGNYTATILLAPGVYEYKFIVNDTWSIDPNCPEWIQNSFGTLNSVLHV